VSDLTDELAAEFDQLRADVAAWCRAMLPCLEAGCSHPAADHANGGGGCYRCDCWGYSGRRGQIIDRVTVTVGETTADVRGDRPHPGQEHTP